MPTLVVVSLILIGLFGYLIGTSQTNPEISPSSITLPDLPATAVWVIKTNGMNYWAVNQNGSIHFTSTNASYVLNSAVKNLTPDRTWIETVLIAGNVTTTSPTLLPSFTQIRLDGVIKSSAESSTNIFLNADQDKGNTQIYLTGGELNGAGQSSGSCGLIYFKKVTNSSISNMRLTNAYSSALSFIECGSIDVLNNFFASNRQYSIWVQSHAEFGTVLQYGGKIEGNTFNGNRNNIILVGKGSYLVDWIIMGNWLYGGTYGVRMYAENYVVSDVYVWANYFDSQTYNAIETDGTAITKCLIQNNKIEESGQHGIELNSIGKTWMITGNYIGDSGKSKDVTYDGIFVNSTCSGNADNAYESLKISDNVVRQMHTMNYGTNHRTRYGLDIVPTLNNVWVADNYFEGGTAAYTFTRGNEWVFHDNVNGTIAEGIVTYNAP